MNDTNSGATARSEERIVVYAFADLPVHILWIERNGQIVREQTIAIASESAECYPGMAHDFETLRTALQHVAIMDDADCAHANNPEAMKKIARDALRSVK